MAESQPLYDRLDFFNGYLTLPRSQKGLDGAPEWPTLRDMVGNVRDQQVLDIGCGLGWFSRYAIEAGAMASDASDVSSRMIERAREMTQSDKISYKVADLNEIEIQENQYELAYSSLALHYLPNSSIVRLFKLIYASLKPGGRFVFSVEHPIYTSPSKAILEKLPDGREVWPLDSYAAEGLRETDWLGGVRKYHRTMTTYMKELIDAGFVIKRFVEWMSTDKDVSMYPSWRAERARPMFLMMKVEKPKAE